MGGCWGWGSWGHWGSGWGLIGPILNLVFAVGLVALVVIGIVWAVRTLRRRPVGAALDAEMDPLEIARRRLARGEITLEEFEVIREHLMV